MRIHKEGKSILIILLLTFATINFALAFKFPGREWINYGIGIVSLVLFLLILQFFRNPKRLLHKHPKEIICPADGKVVVIEETEETELLHDQRIQISIFMSPTNVHVNRNPVAGIIKNYIYHKGRYLCAWNPKASTDNERTTVLYEMENGTNVLLRQVAGAVARRICCYLKSGEQVEQGEDFGFIKFGSRVDLYLPLDATINVTLEQKVKGGMTSIATLA